MFRFLKEEKIFKTYCKNNSAGMPDK